jgi:hypothetical protein
LLIESSISLVVPLFIFYLFVCFAGNRRVLESWLDVSKLIRLNKQKQHRFQSKRTKHEMTVLRCVCWVLVL